jgi:hypothetical protein
MGTLTQQIVTPLTRITVTRADLVFITNEDWTFSVRKHFHVWKGSQHKTRFHDTDFSDGSTLLRTRPFHNVEVCHAQCRSCIYIQDIYIYIHRTYIFIYCIYIYPVFISLYTSTDSFQFWAVAYRLLSTYLMEVLLLLLLLLLLITIIIIIIILRCYSPLWALVPFLISTLWFSILLRVYYKSSLTSTVRNFSLIYLFILFLTSTTRHVSAHPQAILRCDSYKHNILRRSLTSTNPLIYCTMLIVF